MDSTSSGLLAVRVSEDLTLSAEVAMGPTSQPSAVETLENGLPALPGPLPPAKNLWEISRAA